MAKLKTGTTIGGNTAWHSGNDGNGSGLDADTLDGIQLAPATTSGEVKNAIPYVKPDSVMEVGRYIDMHTSGSTADYDVRINCSSADVLQFDGLGSTGLRVGASTVWHSGNDGSSSGLDADLLDGVQASSFLRSDADDTFTGALVSSARNNGIFGTYDSYKTDHIWSMGTSYKNASDGSNFGTLYGLAYKHTNNTTGGTMAGGHQMVWCNNGTPKSAVGDNLWTSGNVLATSGEVACSTVDVSSNIQIGSEVVLQESTDRADLLQITSTTSGWGGLQIRNSSNEGRWSFMTDGEQAGIYNDEDNQWHMQFNETGSTVISHASSPKLATTSTGVVVTGTLTASSSMTATAFYYSSDESLKDNIETIPNALEKVKELRGVEYDWKESGEHSVGLIAQEVETIFPELVTEVDDIKRVNYGQLTAVLIEAVKEQQSSIDNLQAQIDELKSLISTRV